MWMIPIATGIFIFLILIGVKIFTCEQIKISRDKNGNIIQIDLDF